MLSNDQGSFHPRGTLNPAPPHCHHQSSYQSMTLLAWTPTFPIANPCDTGIIYRRFWRRLFPREQGYIQEQMAPDSLAPTKSGGSTTSFYCPRYFALRRRCNFRVPSCPRSPKNGNPCFGCGVGRRSSSLANKSISSHRVYIMHLSFLNQRILYSHYVHPPYGLHFQKYTPTHQNFVQHAN